MATFNKDFIVKNGLIVQGSTAIVNGNTVLTTASSIDALSDVVISTPTNGQVLSYNGTNWVNAAASGTSLPSQTGNAGEFLITDGTNASWSNTATANSTSTVGLIVKGLSSQSADLQQWQNSSGTALSLVDAGGNWYSSRAYLGAYALYDSRLNINTVNASDKGIVVRGVASQTGSLQEWQNSSATVLASIASSGTVVFGGSTVLNSTFGFTLLNKVAGIYYTPNNSSYVTAFAFARGNSTGGWMSLGSIGDSANGVASIAIVDSSGTNPIFRVAQSGTTTITPSASAQGLIVKGASSQTANLQEWQNSSATVLAKVDLSGNLTAASFVKTSGTSTQFLKADGSVDSSTYLTTATASSTYAPIASPTFTGTPLSTTAAADTNTTQIATTAFVIGQASSSNPLALGSVAVGTSLKYARADHVHPTTGLGLTASGLNQFAATTSSQLAGVISDETGSGALVFANTPTLVTPNIGVATGTSFNSITGLSSTTPNANGAAAVGTATTTARADHVHPTTGLGLTSGTLAQFAATTSSQLAGVISDETGSGALVFANSPTLVTPALGVATGTSFNSITGLASTTSPMNGTAAVGTGTTVARVDHVHPTDTSRAPLASPTFTGTVTVPSPTNATDAATKQYVDDLAQGLHIHASVVAATTANLTATYSNGSSGVGATLTNSGTLAAFSIDGVSPVQNDRILVKNQSTTFQNGVYTLTTVGSGSVAWVLTRATDFDTAAEMDGGDFVFVTSGTVGDNTGWVQTETVATVGTSPVLFTQFSGAGTYTAGDGLSLTGNQFAVNSTVVRTSGNQTIAGDKTFSGNVNIAGILDLTNTGVVSALDMSNNSIIGVNKIDFADPGPSEGLAWTGGNFAVFESPNDLTTNSSGNLQFVTGTIGAYTRRMTVNTSGQVEIPVATGTAPLVIASTTAVTNLNADLLDGQHGSYYAPIASPTFTGTPLSTTAAADTNTTQIATTAYVIGQASSSNPLALGSVAVGTSLKYARADHVHPTTGLGLTSGTLAQFAATTSSQLAGVISDETGSGSLVFNNNPALIGAVTFGDGTTVEGRITSSGDTFFIQAGISSVDTTAKLNIARFGTSSTNVSQINAYSDLSTFYGALTTTGAVSINTSGTGTINLGDGTITKTSGSGFTFNSSLAATALSGSLLSSTVGTALGTASAGTATIPARADHVHPTTGLALLSGSTFTGQIQSTSANNTATGGGQIYLNGATGNRIDFNTNGIAAPAFTTRSLGTKIVLYPNVGASAADYAIGIDNSTLWSSVGTTSNSFKWYGGTTLAATLTGAGAFSAVTKSFDIEHPTKEGMRLRYGSLEGPENGVYVRGKSKEKTIELPDYWTGLIDKDTITVNLTAIGSGTLYVKEIIDNAVIVGGTAKEFFFTVYGERKDVDKLTVEY